MRRLTFLLVVTTLWSATLSDTIGQELWLRPDRYFYEPGDEASIQILEGENFTGEPVAIQSADMSRLELWNRAGSQNISARYSPSEKASFSAKLLREGYHFVFMTADRSYEIEGDLFDEYLKQYGLDEQRHERETSGRSAQDVKLTLTHRVQLCLRTGKRDGGGWNDAMNLPIEIVPDKNPQVLRRGDRIQFTVLEKGNPAFGVRVKIWNRWDNRTTIQNIYTEQDGTISTTISNPGDWMVTVVKMNSNPSPNEYVAESFALLFGYR